MCSYLSLVSYQRTYTLSPGPRSLAVARVVTHHLLVTRWDYSAECIPGSEEIVCGLVCGFSGIDGKVDCDYVIQIVGQLNKVSVQVSEFFLFTCVCVCVDIIHLLLLCS